MPPAQAVTGVEALEKKHRQNVSEFWKDIQ